MILIDTIKLPTFGNRKLEYFKSLGYDISLDEIKIDINHLNSGSRIIIPAECDFCKKHVEIFWKEYLRNIKKGGKYACCMYCGSEKAKEKCLIKYGVESAMCLEETQKKQKQTNIEKYGVDNVYKSNEIRNKIDIINIERYGTEYPTQNNNIKEKTKKTNLEKYGKIF